MSAGTARTARRAMLRSSPSNRRIAGGCSDAFIRPLFPIHVRDDAPESGRVVGGEPVDLLSQALFADGPTVGMPLRTARCRVEPVTSMDPCNRGGLYTYLDIRPFFA